MILHHVGVVTRDYSRAIAPFVALGRLALVDDRRVPEWHCRCRLYELGVSYTYFEVVEPYAGPLLTWMESRDGEMHHAAFRVPSIIYAMNQLRDRGMRLVAPEPVVGVLGLRVNFIHPSVSGALIELVEVPDGPLRDAR